jgi:hypothetical protein
MLYLLGHCLACFAVCHHHGVALVELPSCCAAVLLLLIVLKSVAISPQHNKVKQMLYV